MSIKVCRKQSLAMLNGTANRHDRTNFTGNKRNFIITVRVGGKLTKFRGHEGITENHESFYPRKLLAVWYQLLKTSIHVCSHMPHPPL